MKFIKALFGGKDSTSGRKKLAPKDFAKTREMPADKWFK